MIAIGCVVCRHVNRYAGPHEALVHAHCLYRFDEPVSPHLAAGMASAEGKAGAWVSINRVLLGIMLWMCTTHSG
jgi:hypothetical protein